jgi:hypothetical protein
VVNHLFSGIVASIPIGGNILHGSTTSGRVVIGATSSEATVQPEGDDGEILLIGTPVMEK